MITRVLAVSKCVTNVQLGFLEEQARLSAACDEAVVALFSKTRGYQTWFPCFTIILGNYQAFKSVLSLQTKKLFFLVKQHGLELWDFMGCMMPLFITLNEDMIKNHYLGNKLILLI